jgi:hypothetical protein
MPIAHSVCFGMLTGICSISACYRPSLQTQAAVSIFVGPPCIQPLGLVSPIVLASPFDPTLTPLALELLDTSHNSMQASERKHECRQGMHSTSQHISPETAGIQITLGSIRA